MKITTHPDKEIIISRLLNGDSPNVISDWLANKYSTEGNKHFRITAATLNTFRNEYLNLDREAVRNLKKQQREKLKKEFKQYKPGDVFAKTASTMEELEHMRTKEALLQNSPTYREKLQQITDAALDGPRLMKELSTLLQSRLEVYFNEIASATNIGDALKADKMFAEYVSLMKDVIKDSKKVWDEYNSEPDEGSVDLNVVHQMVGVVRDTVTEVLSEFGPELSLEFMDKLNTRLSAVQYKLPEPPDMIARAEKLSNKIKKIQEETAK